MSDYGYDLDERLDDYRDVNLLCWAFYPNQRAFSLFPQLCLRNGEIEKVDNAIFQDDGSFTVMPTGDSGSIPYQLSQNSTASWSSPKPNGLGAMSLIMAAISRTGCYASSTHIIPNQI